MGTAISKRGPFERERRWRKVLHGKTTYTPLRGVLWVLSLFYRSAVSVRNAGYNIGLFPVAHSCLPVVSIGAITCGGARKTPLTAHIARKLQKPVAILTSGYAAARYEPSKAVTLAANGDEAYLLSLKLPFAKVYANKRRIESAKLAENENVEYILLDSGLQHRALKRDIEIVAVNAKETMEDHYFLPRGYLKDSPSRLKDANWVVVMDAENEAEYDKACRRIKKINRHASIFGMRAKFAKPELIYGKRVSFFCGIAKPEGFSKMIREAGAQIVSEMVLADHEPLENVARFVGKSQQMGAEFVVCTEKDFVKLPPTECEKIVPLELVVDVCYGEIEYEKMLSAINARCER